MESSAAYTLSRSSRYNGIAALLFVVLFPLLRLTVFGEPVLTLVIDRAEGRITVRERTRWIVRKTAEPVSALRDIVVRSTEYGPGNADAVDFVRRIALQHGTIPPGFGESDRYYAVDLVFDERTVTVFSGRREADARGLKTRIDGFVRSVPSYGA